MPYTFDEAEAIAAKATPWPEIERLALAVRTRSELDALQRRLEAERPYLGISAGQTLGLMRGWDPCDPSVRGLPLIEDRDPPVVLP